MPINPIRQIFTIFALGFKICKLWMRDHLYWCQMMMVIRQRE